MRKMVLIIFTLIMFGSIIPGAVISNTLLVDPYPASNPNPLNNSINIDINTDLSWTGSSPDPLDTVSYNIFFGTTISPPVVEIVYYDTIYNPGILEYNTQYFWRIDSYGDIGGATTGPLWTFTTRDDTPPYIPSNPSPLNNSLNISILTNLSWTGGDPDGDNVTYAIYFGVLPNPPLVESNYANISFNLGFLNYNTQYYWRIIAWDIYGYSTAGPLWTFTTSDDTPPYVPSNPSPLNNSLNISILTNLSWTGGDPDGDNVTYAIYFGVLPNPPLVESNSANLTDNPGVLTYNTQYYWRIIAWDSYAYSTAGPLWTFTTRENQPPYTPFNPIPKNRSTNIYIDAILSWSGGDPDSHNVTYDVYFGDTENLVKIISNQTQKYYQPNVMNITTTYFWRIIAWDNLGKSSIGPLWNFKTSIYENSPPNKPSTPIGPITGKSGISYSYSSSTTDSNDEPIFYMFDWDDGTLSEWIGPFDSGQTITTSHIWENKGNYAIKVKAKDIYGGESFWSDPLEISMPKSKPYLSFIEERFPFLFNLLSIFTNNLSHKYP